MSFAFFSSDIDTVTTFIRVVVISNSTGTLTPSQACALTSTQPTGTQEVLIRTGIVKWIAYLYEYI